MDRRSFMATAAMGAAGLTLTGGRAFANGRKPNIIIIMADDLGYGDVSCYGSQAISTPNIDRLAEEGVRLTSFFSSGPVCSPSRAGLLTGRYPQRSGVNFVYVPTALLPVAAISDAIYRMPWGMPTEEITLAQAIKQAGYATCCIGKWHLGDLKKYRPQHRGFDYYFGVLHANDAFPLRLYRNDEVVEPSPVNQDYLTRKYTAEAVAWIKSHSDQPFLLYLPHTFPHIPLHASPDFRGKSRGGLYGDCVQEIDWSTGKIMETLKDLGIADNTFVFFTSDNGPWYQGNPGNNRGRKGDIFDGGMRVPGIAWMPGVVPAGRVSDEMSMNFDLFATALALAGVGVPQDRPIDGRNMIPMLAGEAGSPHDALFFYKDRRLQAVRAGHWKYHKRHMGWTAGAGTNQAHFAVSTFQKHGPMLFDLETDPNESYNVSHLYPEKARELQQLMDDWEKGFIKGVPKKWNKGN